MKRVLLFVATNLAVVFTVQVVWALLASLGVVPAGGTNELGGLFVLCLLWGSVGSFISLQMSRFMAKQSMGLKLIDGRTGNPDLDRVYNTIGNLTRQANLPMPEVGVYDSPEVNAFATGPSKNRSLVAVSTGLLQSMDQNEVEGVLGHEITHIANGDMVTMALLQGVINAFVMFFARIVASLFMRSDSDGERRPGFAYYMLVQLLSFVLGLLGSVVVCWFSRQREFRADAGGAALAGRGNMVAALRRLEQTEKLVDNSQPALATLKIAGGGGIFATHPPLAVRIAALEGRAA
jgi:heat shock protein HtpX